MRGFLVVMVGAVAMSVMTVVVMGVAVRGVGLRRMGVMAVIVVAVRRLRVMGDGMGVVAMIGGVAMGRVTMVVMGMAVRSVGFRRMGVMAVIVV
ncbi:MAG: hypothetical protein ACOVMO_15055, partial [Caulobacter sp.]